MCALHRVTASFRHIHLLRHGVLHGLRVDVCSTVDLRGLQGDSLPHHGLHHRLQGNLCSGAWSISPSSFPDLGVCRAVSHLHFLCHSFSAAFFSPSEIRHHRGATSIADGLSFDQQQICLGAGWNLLCPARGQLLVSSHRSHPCSPCLHPQLTKPCHINPIGQQSAAGQVGGLKNREREPQRERQRGEKR